jgi:UDPglucose--hexose-1-phosphate uridylyltransferase
MCWIPGQARDDKPVYCLLVPVYYLAMSQFRKDPVSGEWVILAPERGLRPHSFKNTKRVLAPKSKCPFEDLMKSGNWPPVLEYDEKGKWQIVVLPNKYPALKHEALCPQELADGPYRVTEGIGYHELLITRDHAKSFPMLPPVHALEVFRLFGERYRTIDKDHCMAYLSVFANWGPSAGASIAHPHYQLMALPVIPPVIQHSYDGSAAYFKKNKSCVHCDIIATERKKKVRIIAENSEAIAMAPFVSRDPYEVKIFPKKHSARFEGSTEAALKGVAVLLQSTLAAMKKKLGDPDYNFYIHTAPLLDQLKYDHYHWHVEVAPKISIPAGFELATGIDINAVDPDTVAKLLR